MNYDEDLLVELIACGEVSQTEIAERVGVSRRTVWKIVHSRSRPDLQQKIADTVEGYRQETIRLAARFMKPILKKQIEVALEGDGETARKCREFLLKTFMTAAPQQAAKRQAKRADDESLNPAMRFNSVMELSPELQGRMSEELGLSRPDDERLSATEDTLLRQGFGGQADAEEATVLPSPSPSPVAPDVHRDQLPVATPLAQKEVPPAFSTKVTLPDGTRVYRETLRIIAEAEAEAATIKPRRRVKRAPR